MLRAIFASIIGALHRSRRLQARRIRRQYRHLIAAARQDEVQIPQSRRGGDANVRR